MYNPFIYAPCYFIKVGVDNQADPLGLAITPFLSYTKRQITQQASNHSGCVLANNTRSTPKTKERRQESYQHDPSNLLVTSGHTN